LFDLNLKCFQLGLEKKKRMTNSKIKIYQSKDGLTEVQVKSEDISITEVFSIVQQEGKRIVKNRKSGTRVT